MSQYKHKKSNQFVHALIASALALGASNAFAHRTYNVTGFAGSLDPDFTLHGSDGGGLPSPSYSGGSGPNGSTAGASAYKGSLPVSWMAALHAATNEEGEVFKLSTADALTGPGTSNNGVSTTPSNFVLGAGGLATGTGFDFGYLRVDNAQSAPNGVRITVSADHTLGSTLKPYIALYAGWDHSWTGADGATKEAPGGGSSADRLGAYVAGDGAFGSDLHFVSDVDNNDGLDTVTLFFSTLKPTGHYTLLIGGVGGSAGAYTATVETAVVPLPAAAWLCASACGVLLSRRRKARVAAGDTGA